MIGLQILFFPSVYLILMLTKFLFTDLSLKSVITFDRGVTWQPIYLGTEDCKVSFMQDAVLLCVIHVKKLLLSGFEVRVKNPCGGCSVQNKKEKLLWRRYF